MPELPEVQTIVNELSQTLPGLTIVNCNILRPSVVVGNPNHFQSNLLNRTIQKITRRGKFILFSFADKTGLLVHLKMTGKFVLQPAQTSSKPHDRVQFNLSNGLWLIYNDIRCFGKLEFLLDNSFHPSLERLGIDALDPELNKTLLLELFQNKKTPVKSLLLNSAVIAGIGNIYASEILFEAGLSPFMAAGSLSLTQAEKLVAATRFILEAALSKNGTTISDYRRVDSKQGEFQNFLKVYQKQNIPCQICSSLIIKAKQNQRSTFYCPKCQK